MIDSDTRPVLFFDIDNCLYSKSLKIANLMGQLIDKYFEDHLSLSENDATTLHKKYYTEYGLALEGLVRHHKVNALEYNSKVDDALPLEDIIKPDCKLRNLLHSLDRTKVKPWLFTNAYVTHGKRVVRLLGVEDCFEGITFCDYGAEKLVCKPYQEAFDRAMKQAGVTDHKQCYFVDDSALNIKAATELGWTAVHLLEPSDIVPERDPTLNQIQHLQELREVLPQFFKPSVTA